MLRHISVSDLSGVDGHSVSLPVNEDVTILTGDNGSGKTTILNILSALSAERVRRLFGIQFSRAVVEYDEGTIEITRTDAGITLRYVDAVDRIVQDAKDKGLEITQESRRDLKRLVDGAPRAFVFTDPLKEIVNRYYAFVGRSESDRPSFFRYFVKSLYFPTYRRLERELRELTDVDRSDRYLFLHEVVDYARVLERQSGVVIGSTNDDIDRIVKGAWSTATDQEKNRLSKLILDFAASLFDFSGLEEPNPKECKALESAFVETFEKAGALTKKLQHSIHNYFDAALDFGKESKDKNVERELEVLIAFSKLKRFSELHERASAEIRDIQTPLTTLIRTLNTFLSKGASITEDGSLTFTLNKQTLSFERLSAGEKQLVALLVYVRLATTQDTMVLVDEPELSLHVGWQRQFLSAVLDLAPGRQLIVATHSPFIIGKYGNRVVQIGEVSD